MNYKNLKALSLEDWELIKSVLNYAEDQAILKNPKLQKIISTLGGFIKEAY